MIAEKEVLWRRHTMFAESLFLKRKGGRDLAKCGQDIAGPKVRSALQPHTSFYLKFMATLGSDTQIIAGGLPSGYR